MCLVFPVSTYLWILPEALFQGYGKDWLIALVLGHKATNLGIGSQLEQNLAKYRNLMATLRNLMYVESFIGRAFSISVL